ncbi:MAG: rhodanese-like domain-containing protein [Lachnospiraceae bacterium]|nr:rhodanese-like domain-containing protein [Lachnospiraceae bacterium]
MEFGHINIRQIMETVISKNGIIVDVRKAKFFREGHIPMAVSLPLTRIEQGQVTLPKNKTLIVYCETGGTSTQACRLLHEMGYDVINCVGGLASYRGSLTK